jgi:hypothetical protein
MMGIRKVFAAGLASVLAVPLLTAGAEAAEWWIERMSGNVQIHNGESWVRLNADRQLSAGDSVWTGRNGRILLVNNQGSVLLAPKSLVKIPAQALPNSFSVLFQTHGKVSAEVDKRRKRHFSIQTPYLAAVVKGTEFDVEVDGDKTRIDVSEGLVGVVDVETGEQTDIAAGESLAVGTAASSSGSGPSRSRQSRETRESEGKELEEPETRKKQMKEKREERERSSEEGSGSGDENEQGENEQGENEQGENEQGENEQ